MRSPRTPLPVGRGPDQFFLVRLQADGNELSQGCTVVIEHAEGAVAGSGHGTGLIDDMTQQSRQFEVSLDQQCCFKHPPQLGRIIDGPKRHTKRLP